MVGITGDAEGYFLDCRDRFCDTSVTKLCGSDDHCEAVSISLNDGTYCVESHLESYLKIDQYDNGFISPKLLLEGELNNNISISIENESKPIFEWLHNLKSCELVQKEYKEALEEDKKNVVYAVSAVLIPLVFVATYIAVRELYIYGRHEGYAPVDNPLGNNLPDIHEGGV